MVEVKVRARVRTEVGGKRRDKEIGKGSTENRKKSCVIVSFGFVLGFRFKLGCNKGGCAYGQDHSNTTGV